MYVAHPSTPGKTSPSPECKSRTHGTEPAVVIGGLSCSSTSCHAAVSSVKAGWASLGDSNIYSRPVDVKCSSRFHSLRYCSEYLKRRDAVNGSLEESRFKLET
jgi:hypothetical protein